MTGARRLATGLALVGALLGVTGCASSVDPIERLGRKAAERVGGGEGEGLAGRPEAGVCGTGEAAADARRFGSSAVPDGSTLPGTACRWER